MPASVRFCASFLGILAACLLALPARAQDVFGKREASEAALIGTFYDLKQTQARKPTGVTPNDYVTILEEFFNRRWDESVLNRYFRSGRSLYTTQIFIPMMSAGVAPRAFDLQETVKPSCWITHYKGQVSPPSDGRFRFVGYADDVIAVAVNETTVLLSSRFQQKVWQSPEKQKAGWAGNGPLVYGDWIELKKGEIVDLDVLIGERPGGDFCAFLLYQKENMTYPMTTGTRPQSVLPVFQLSPYTIPAYDPKLAPAVFQTTETWKGSQ